MGGINEVKGYYNKEQNEVTMLTETDDHCMAVILKTSGDGMERKNKV